MGRTSLKVAVVLLVAILLGATGVWADTSPGTDIQQRAARLAADHHVRLLAPSELPTRLVDALVVTEDERFWEHHGVDLIGMTRALTYDAGHACACQGGSTVPRPRARFGMRGPTNWTFRRICRPK